MSRRPNILALASKISLESLTYTGITYKDPEYRILDPIVDDDMYSIMMRMRLERTSPLRTWPKKRKKRGIYPGAVRQAGQGRRDPRPLSRRKAVRTTPSGSPALWRASSTAGAVRKYPDLGKCFEEYTRIRVGMPVLGSESTSCG